jgi:hypothetical protein
MSDTAWAESLLTRFVIPLIDGAEVHVGAPLGVRGALRLKDAVAGGLDGTASGQALRAARRVLLAEIGCADEPPTLLDDVGAPSLIVALHDLLFLQHPESTRLKPEACGAVKRTAQTLAKKAELFAAAAELPTLLGRHSLLGRLLLLQRDDTRRKTRNGLEVYRGQPAPRRWLPFSEDDDEVLRVAVLPELERLGNDVWQVILWGSPLTALLHPLCGLTIVDVLQFGGWLAVPQVARLITRRYLELGLPAVGPVLSDVLQHGLGAPPQAACLAWVRLCSHLHLVAHILGGMALPAPSAAPELLGFYALFPALCAKRPELAAPPDVWSDPSLRLAVEQHAARCKGLVASSRVPLWDVLI